MYDRDLRRYRRVPYGGLLRICSEDANGNAVYRRTKCVDVSEGGMRIESQAPFSVGTYLSVRADQPSLGGYARVKRVAQKGSSKYILGLELSQPLPSEALARVRETWALHQPASAT
jgi:hypothetical protein